MSYTHLTKTELIFIEKYFEVGLKGRQIAEKLQRGHESIYRVIRQLKEGKTVIEIYRQYKKNKQKCGRKPIQLPQGEINYINKKLDEDWNPDVIIGRKEEPISCSTKTLYRMFKKGIFNQEKLPMKGKRKPNGHQEKEASKPLNAASRTAIKNTLTMKKSSVILKEIPSLAGNIRAL